MAAKARSSSGIQEAQEEQDDDEEEEAPRPLRGSLPAADDEDDENDDDDDQEEEEVVQDASAPAKRACTSFPQGLIESIHATTLDGEGAKRRKAQGHQLQAGITSGDELARLELSSSARVLMGGTPASGAVVAPTSPQHSAASDAPQQLAKKQRPMEHPQQLLSAAAGSGAPAGAAPGTQQHAPGSPGHSAHKRQERCQKRGAGDPSDELSCLNTPLTNSSGRDAPATHAAAAPTPVAAEPAAAGDGCTSPGVHQQAVEGPGARTTLEEQCSAVSGLADPGASLDELLRLIRVHPDSEAAVAAALHAVQRLNKRSAPSGASGGQPGSAAKRAATRSTANVDQPRRQQLQQQHASLQRGAQAGQAALPALLERSAAGADAVLPAGAMSEQCHTTATSQAGGCAQPSDTATSAIVLGAVLEAAGAREPAAEHPRAHKARAKAAAASAGPYARTPSSVGQDQPRAGPGGGGVHHEGVGVQHGSVGQVGLVPAGERAVEAARVGSVSGGSAHATGGSARAALAALASVDGEAVLPQARSGATAVLSSRMRGDTGGAAAAGAGAAERGSSEEDGSNAALLTAALPVPDINTYLEAFPLSHHLVGMVRGTPNNSTKTPLALVNEYAARLTLEVMWAEEADSMAGPYTATCTLQSRSAAAPHAQGSGRGRNKRDARQVAAAACLEVLLGPEHGVQLLDFLVSTKAAPSAPGGRTPTLPRDASKPGLGFIGGGAANSTAGAAPWVAAPTTRSLGAAWAPASAATTAATAAASVRFGGGPDSDFSAPSGARPQADMVTGDASDSRTLVALPTGPRREARWDSSHGRKRRDADSSHARIMTHSHPSQQHWSAVPSTSHQHHLMPRDHHQGGPSGRAYAHSSPLHSGAHVQPVAASASAAAGVIGSSGGAGSSRGLAHPEGTSAAMPLHEVHGGQHMGHRRDSGPAPFPSPRGYVDGPPQAPPPPAAPAHRGGPGPGPVPYGQPPPRHVYAPMQARSPGLPHHASAGTHSRGPPGTGPDALPSSPWARAGDACDGQPPPRHQQYQQLHPYTPDAPYPPGPSPPSQQWPVLHPPPPQPGQPPLYPKPGSWHSRDGVVLAAVDKGERGGSSSFGMHSLQAVIQAAGESMPAAAHKRTYTAAMDSAGTAGALPPSSGPEGPHGGMVAPVAWRPRSVAGGEGALDLSGLHGSLDATLMQAGHAMGLMGPEAGNASPVHGAGGWPPPADAWLMNAGMSEGQQGMSTALEVVNSVLGPGSNSSRHEQQHAPPPGGPGGPSQGLGGWPRSAAPGVTFGDVPAPHFGSGAHSLHPPPRHALSPPPLAHAAGHSDGQSSDGALVGWTPWGSGWSTGAAPGGGGGLAGP